MSDGDDSITNTTRSRDCDVLSNAMLLAYKQHTQISRHNKLSVKYLNAKAAKSQTLAPPSGERVMSNALIIGRKFGLCCDSQ